jgi:hypothetical protein
VTSSSLHVFLSANVRLSPRSLNLDVCLSLSHAHSASLQHHLPSAFTFKNSDDNCPPLCHKDSYDSDDCSDIELDSNNASDDESNNDDDSVDTPPLSKVSSRRTPSSSRNNTASVAHSQPTNDTTDSCTPAAPIRVLPKPPKGKRHKNVFIDDRGFPDQSHELDTLLHSMSGTPLLRKRQHPAPPIDVVDPAFNFQYDPAVHDKQFQEDFKPSPRLTLEQNDQLAALLKKYWCVFDHRGLFVPVKDYICDIDTGTAAPIAVKGINYGPYETPIMRKCISKLEQLGHISQIRDGPWLFKALLAPKPHQEHVREIADFVWRFCVNYIPLNAVTQVNAYPIPRCDSMVMFAFGDAIYFWLMDAPQGYHQLRVSPGSRIKLAFQGPDAIKWTYNVMPFGPVNGPAIFVEFIHDVDGTWKQVAIKRGVPINDSNNTRIIIDDIFSHSVSFDIFLQLLESQLLTAWSQNLSLNLKKCHWIPERLKFVGIDVTADGNRPAQSKHQLLDSWPVPTIVRDVSSFIGFAIFYSKFIPLFESRITRLREITTLESTELVAPVWDSKAQSEFDDIRNAILADPVLRRFDYRRRTYLLSDFCKNGFGYVACQPGNDPSSLAAMHREMAGGDCEFLLPNSKLLLHPVAFGCRRTRGNETRFHSHLGEGFAGDWAINKIRHMIFGQEFTWVTDCYDLCFILSYDDNNPTILRLQMRLMCWSMTIIHRPGTVLTSADYFSRLGADLCFDPFLKDYVQRVLAMKQSSPPVTSLPIMPENMPGYCKPRTPSAPTSETLDMVAVNLVASIFIDPDPAVDISSSISHHPVCFGSFDPSVNLDRVYKASPFYNSELVLAARTINHFQWAVYSFNNGHFVSSINSKALPFRVVLCSDMYAEGRALFKEFTNCPLILPGIRELLDHVRRSGDRSKLDGYILHSHRFPDSATTRNFWQLQASLI